MKPHPESERLQHHDVYQGDKQPCDVVMKGGITSGVTYPMAICEIATAYELRNIGGTSAGAIAAAAAAAAEVGRGINGAGFARLAQLPGRLSKIPKTQSKSVLFNLFRPWGPTRPLFRILAGFQESKLRGALSVLRAAPVASVVGASLGIALFTLLALVHRGYPNLRSNAVAVAAMGLGFIASFILILVGGLIGAGSALLRRTLRTLPTNGFGLCAGFVPGTPVQAGTEDGRDLQIDPNRKVGPKPLATWLADELDALAGKQDASEPLTLKDVAQTGTSIRMLTTNLTDGTPYSLPFRTRDFFFKKEEFEALFPKRIVDWMMDHLPTPEGPDEPQLFHLMRNHKDGPLLPLPDPEHLPLVVMARLSLSFPFLLSAVPLWARMYSPDKRENVIVKCWFSDGGMTSNFPIHFFDNPLPRWPTFGINLGPGRNLDTQDESKNLYAPTTNGGGSRARWTGINTVGEFARAIADTMQNWMDNAQVRVPGYRDRIVMIKHTKHEGGMNLNMAPELIDRFSERGRRAGEYLVKRFVGPTSQNERDRLSWRNHKWLRYRSIMPLMQRMLNGFVVGYEWKESPYPGHTYPELLEAGNETLPGYEWCNDVSQPERARQITEALRVHAHTWAVPSEPEPASRLSISRPQTRWDPDWPFDCDAPRPRPALRIMRDF